MKRICTVNARAGSKGVPGKNLAIVAGLPLLAHSLEQAKESGIFDLLAVSSDSSEILEVARTHGALAIERPAELASDSAPKLPSIVHSVKMAEEISGLTFSTVVDLDATSPLRNSEDIVGAVELLETEGLDSVFTATHSRRSPFFNQVSKSANGVWGPVISHSNTIFRRQDAPETFDMNASIYAWNKDSLFRSPSVFQESSAMYLMPEERSWDIDSKFDFEVVSFLLERKKGLR
jgi:N-acylneuraminate cytidylyltransferase/CMP-N,N'-diacetyllegionaminic acid synthase